MERKKINFNERFKGKTTLIDKDGHFGLVSKANKPVRKDHPSRSALMASKKAQGVLQDSQLANTSLLASQLGSIEPPPSTLPKLKNVRSDRLDLRRSVPRPQNGATPSYPNEMPTSSSSYDFASYQSQAPRVRPPLQIGDRKRDLVNASLNIMHNHIPQQASSPAMHHNRGYPLAAPRFSPHSHYTSQANALQHNLSSPTMLASHEYGSGFNVEPYS